MQTRMQSLRPEPAARYRNVLEALWRIARTEGVWRPMRGMNITATGAGPAHALYFACYEKLKKTLSDVIHAGGNSHVANGTAPDAHQHPLPPWGATGAGGYRGATRPATPGRERGGERPSFGGREVWPHPARPQGLSRRCGAGGPRMS